MLDCKNAGSTMYGMRCTDRSMQPSEFTMAENLHKVETPKIKRTKSYRLTSLHATLRKRTLDEFPMDHNWTDAVRMSARRRQEKETRRRNLASTCGESQQLSSYGRKRFETALTGSGKSLPPPSPEDRSIFWDEKKPSWSRRRHHSVAIPPSAATPSVQLLTRPGSEPPGSVASRNRKDSPSVFNHLRGNNSMYPIIKRLLQNSNTEYRVVCAEPPTDLVDSFTRRASIDHSVVTDCYLVPLKEDASECSEELDDKARPDIPALTRDATAESDHSVSVEELGEQFGELTSEDVVKPDQTPSTNVGTEIADADKEDEEELDEPSAPWRCWVDDATVSSIAPESDPEMPVDDLAAPQSPVPEIAPEISVPLPAADATSKNKLRVLGKQGRASSSSIDKREGAASPVSPVGKRKSSARLKKKKGRKGTPEPLPVEAVELPPPPPPPPTPPVVEVEEKLKEEEQEVEPVLPPYICPSSITKSTDTEIKLWLRKSSFSAANRTLPIF